MPCTRKAYGNRSWNTSTTWIVRRVGWGWDDTVIFVDVDAVWATTDVGSLSGTSHGAAIGSWNTTVGDCGTAVAFSSIFHAGVVVTGVIASIHALRWGHESDNIGPDGDGASSRVIASASQ